jgi:hypothetical protein
MTPANSFIDRAQHARFLPLLLTAVVLAIVLVPVWSVTVPPLNDYLNHLARMFIIVHLDSDPYLQKMYELHTALVPNLAIDAIVPLLAQIMPLYDAGRVFVSLILVLWVGGPIVLHYALHNRFSLWPLIAGFIAYNASFQWGFANYVFGAGLMFFALAAWIRSEGMAPVMRLTLFTVVTVALYFSHLLAVFLYGLAIVAYEVGQARQVLGQPGAAWLRRWAPAAGQFVVPALCLFFVSPSGKHLDLATLIDLEVRITYLSRFVYALRSPAWMEQGIVDYVAVAFLYVVIAVGFATHRLIVHRRFLTVLIGVGVPTAALVFLRYNLDNVLLHVRFMPVFAALLVAGTSWRPSPSPRLLAATFGVGAALFVVRMALLTNQWSFYDRQFDEFRQALSVVPRGSAVFEAMVHDPVVQPPHLHGNGEYPYEFMTELAIIERSAFSPLLFIFRDLQMVRMTPAYRPIAAGDMDPLDWDVLAAHAVHSGPPQHFQDGWPAHFDYVVALHPAGRDESLKQWLTPVRVGSFFTIFRVVKSAEVAQPGTDAKDKP